MSFLIALPPAIWMSGSRMEFLIQWMALSAVACLLDMATQRKQMHVRVKPVSTSYLNKVINGV
jgi:cytochrome oxidase assembly protein ShyY1